MIKLLDILNEALEEEKKKADRCLCIARSRYGKKSTAYRSGAIVRCRQGDIWTDLKEDIRASEAYEDKSALQTVVDGKRDLGFIAVKASPMNKEEFWDTVRENNLQTISVPSNDYEAYIYFRPEAKNKAIELRDIAEKYGGYLYWDATIEDSRRIGELLGYVKEDIDDYIERVSQKKGIKEGESLHKWFSHRGGGWVDCNTCRNGKCKPCGRQKGEKRAKYPSCRPTPAACKDPGKGKTWGKTK